MTIKEASERYNIPMEILREYESWGRAANTAFAQYFIGNSYLNPLTKPGESTVGLEPVDDEAYSKLQ